MVDCLLYGLMLEKVFNDVYASTFMLPGSTTAIWEINTCMHKHIDQIGTFYLTLLEPL